MPLADLGNACPLQRNNRHAIADMVVAPPSMRCHVRRRKFITLAGGIAAWPIVANAQHQTMPVIGFLYAGSPRQGASIASAFRQGLRETGFVENQNVAIDFRWAEGQLDRLPALAADLVSRKVAVIATPVTSVAAFAAKAATTTIPIVFSTGTDPVQIGLVSSLSRPTGNITGVTGMSVDLASKRLGLLQELLPLAARFAVLVNNFYKPMMTDLQAAAANIKRHIEVITFDTDRDIEIAFASMGQKQVDALLVSPDPVLINRRAQVVTLAARHAVPTIYPFREDAEAGGLMSYGPSLTDNARNVGIYVGRILKGEKPADLPVLRATKFELVINLATARLLRINVPPELIALADELIE